MQRNRLQGFLLTDIWQGETWQESCAVSEAPAEPPTPLSPKTPRTPKFFKRAECLRYFISDTMTEHVQNGRCHDPTHNSFWHLVKRYPLSEASWDLDLWHLALRCPGDREDIPVCQFAKRNLHHLIGDLFSVLQYDERERKELLEAPGAYGRTALQHAVDCRSWKAADILVRLHANIGFTSDRLGVVDRVLKCSQQMRNTAGSWRNIDRDLSRLVLTIITFHGPDWATRRPCGESSDDNNSTFHRQSNSEVVDCGLWQKRHSVSNTSGSSLSIDARLRCKGRVSNSFVTASSTDGERTTSSMSPVAAASMSNQNGNHRPPVSTRTSSEGTGTNDLLLLAGRRAFRRHCTTSIREMIQNDLSPQRRSENSCTNTDSVCSTSASVNNHHYRACEPPPPAIRTLEISRKPS